MCCASESHPHAALHGPVVFLVLEQVTLVAERVVSEIFRVVDVHPFIEDLTGQSFLRWYVNLILP